MQQNNKLDANNDGVVDFSERITRQPKPFDIHTLFFGKKRKSELSEKSSLLISQKNCNNINLDSSPYLISKKKGICKQHLP